MAATSSWFSCSPKKQLEDQESASPTSASPVPASEPAPAAAETTKTEKTAESPKVDTDATAAAAPKPDHKAEKAALKEAKHKAELEKKEKAKAEKEAKKEEAHKAKEAKELAKKESAAAKKEADAQKKAAKLAKKGKVDEAAQIDEPAATKAAATTAEEIAHAHGQKSPSPAAPEILNVNAAEGNSSENNQTENDAAKSPDALPVEGEKPGIMASIKNLTEGIFRKDSKPTPLPFPDQKIVFVLGGPGSGKGTQCAHIKKHYGFEHISAGDLLRHEVSLNTDQGKMIGEMIKNGEIVPVEITLSLLRAALDLKKDAKGFLIDGFPRQVDQATAFESTLRVPDLILFFDCPENILEGRLLKRGETSGRADDNLDSIRKRFQVFAEVSSKCVQFYEQKGKVKVLKIDASVSETLVWEAVQSGFTSIGFSA